jgi:PleD family two-component response regulator
MVIREALADGAITAKRGVFALVADMAAATQIVKCAAALHIAVRNFDKAGKLVAQAAIERPFLVILDFEKCEAEAFRVLNELRNNADLRSVPVVGFVTQAKGMVKPEAEKAGCSRVYMKTEFGRQLPDLIARYAV